MILTVPQRVSRRKALEWASGHREWVERQLAKVTPPESLGPASELLHYGEPPAIDW